MSKSRIARLDHLAVITPDPVVWTPEAWKDAHDAGRVVIHPQQVERLVEAEALLAEEIEAFV